MHIIAALFQYEIRVVTNLQAQGTQDTIKHGDEVKENTRIG